MKGCWSLYKQTQTTEHIPSAQRNSAHLWQNLSLLVGKKPKGLTHPLFQNPIPSPPIIPSTQEGQNPTPGSDPTPTAPSHPSWQGGNVPSSSYRQFWDEHRFRLMDLGIASTCSNLRGRERSCRAKALISAPSFWGAPMLSLTWGMDTILG